MAGKKRKSSHTAPVELSKRSRKAGPASDDSSGGLESAMLAASMDMDDDWADDGGEEEADGLDPDEGGGVDNGSVSDEAEEGEDLEDEEEAFAGLEEGEAAPVGAVMPETEASRGKQKGKGKMVEDAAMDVPVAATRQAFDMQLATLSPSITPPYSQYIPQVTSAIDQLRQYILSLPAEPPVSLAHSRRRLENKSVSVPLEDPKEEVQWKAGFAPPSGAEGVWLAGSWKTRCGTKGEKGPARNGTVDVMVEMPASLFQEKDYLSHRYFHKRAHYLAHLAAALASPASPSASIFSLSYASFRTASHRYAHFQPVLLLTPRPDAVLAKAKLVVRLIPCYEGSPFPVARLSPSRANLKVATEMPTPGYNQLILLDSAELQRTHLSFLENVLQKYPHASALLKLLRVWARIRRLHQVVGLEHWTWWGAFLTAHIVAGGGREVVRGKKAGRATAGLPLGLDALGLFRGVMDWLVKHDFEAPVFLALSPGARPFVDEEFESLSAPVLADPAGRLNLLSGVPLASLKLLRYEAQRTLALLQTPIDVFEPLFLDARAGSFALRFDNQLVVRMTAEDAARIAHAAPESRSGDPASAINTVTDVLTQALGERVKALSVIPVAASAITTSLDSSLVPSSVTILRIGLFLDPVQANALVTRGPAPDVDPDGAARFRSFWSDKAELRRFGDGTIVESVVWSASDPLERAKVTSQVVGWALAKKLGIDPARVRSFVGPYDGLLQEDAAHVKAVYRRDPKIAGFTAVMTSFDQLVRELKGLENLPLGVLDVRAVAPALRYSSTFVPGAIKTRNPSTASHDSFIAALDAHIVFESSGKWPDELEAIQKIKAAFLARIASSLLEGAVATIACVAVTDAEAVPTSDHVALELLHSSGYAFRLRIHHEREAQLLGEALSGEDAFVAKYAEQSLRVYRSRFVDLPKHHGAIAALQTRCPTFTYAVRTTKRWLSSHLLHTGLVPEETVELLCAAAYLCVGPWSDAPGSGATGFARTLALLARWDWRTTPLLVPIMTAVGLDPAKPAVFPLDLSTQAATAFTLQRRSDPAISKAAWFVATEIDVKAKGWAWERPTKLVAGRVQTLAQAALRALQDGAQAEDVFDTKALFRTPTDAYDFRIILSPRATTRTSQALHSPSAVKRSHKVFDGSLIANGDSGVRKGSGAHVRFDDDPTSAFVVHLQDVLGDAVVLFFDPHGGLEISGLFNPSYLVPRAFKSPLDLPMVPAPDDAGPGAVLNGSNGRNDDKVSKRKTVLDRGAVLSEVSRIGAGVVVEIVDQAESRVA